VGQILSGFLLNISQSRYELSQLVIIIIVITIIVVVMQTLRRVLPAIVSQ
jgi:hypothetical protein